MANTTFILANLQKKANICYIKIVKEPYFFLLGNIFYEPELLNDFKEFLEKIIPSDEEYHHDKVWGK